MVVALVFCGALCFEGDAGWSSPVARQAHNLKVTGSNPVPATKISPLPQQVSGFFVVQILAQKSNKLE